MPLEEFFQADPRDLLTVTADIFLAGSLELKANGPMGNLAAGEWGETTTTEILKVDNEEAAIID